MVRIWFEDNGIGIPQVAQKNLFKMFQRGTKEFEGTGIGLALVRKVSSRMGGRVGVESCPGKGSRFWLDLPACLTAADERTSSDRANKSAENTLKN
jgi:signal transduction histidine kinase